MYVNYTENSFFTFFYFFFLPKYTDYSLRTTADEPWGPTSFTGRSEPYCSCGHEKRRDQHAEPPAAEHVGRGDSVSTARATELISNRAVPSAPHTVPAALPAHVAVSDFTVSARVAEIAEQCEFRRQTTNADGKRPPGQCIIPIHGDSFTFDYIHLKHSNGLFLERNYGG